MELEKSKIATKAKVEKAKIEQGTRLRELELNSQDNGVGANLTLSSKRD